MTDQPRFSVAALDELEAIPGPGSLTWRPVRSHFDIRAFGTNAYTAEAAGEDVVERHDEDPPQEELYFVARGRARFELDGESFDAPAGTYVFVREPSVERYAVALEAGTTVLSFGGPPTFEPSSWEWTFRASAQLRAGDLDAADNTLSELRSLQPESPGLHWTSARLALRRGDREGAISALERAVELDPTLTAELRDDSALAEMNSEELGALRGDPGFERLLNEN